MPQPSYPPGQDRDWPLETEIESGSLDSQADRPNRRHFLDAFRALWGVVRARGRPGGVAALAKTTTGNDVAGRVPAAQIGRDLAGGVAPLNAQRKVPAANLPAFGAVPVGGILIWAGGGRDPNPGWDWSWCHGQWLNRDDYPDLWHAISDRFLAGAASRAGASPPQFRLPDLRGRVPMASGRGYNLTQRNGGQRLGHESERIREENLPEHRHMVAGGSYASGAGAHGEPTAANHLQVAHRGGGSEAYYLRGESAAPDKLRSGPAGRSSPTHLPVIPPALVLEFMIRTR